MSENRYDLYKEVHKGIRKELFDLAMLVGSMDFQNPISLETLKETFNRTYNLLETHAHSEDTYVEPLINKVNVDIAKKTSSKHKNLEDDINELRQKLSGMDAHKKDSVVQGHAFYLQLTIFIAEYIKHIADEEKIIMPILWNNYNDEELINTSSKIRMGIPEPIMKNFMTCMIPAMNHSERVAMFTGMKMSAPEEVYYGMCMLVQSFLSSSEWRKLENAVN